MASSRKLRLDLITEEGFEAARTGQPCESPYGRSLERAAWENGWRSGHTKLVNEDDPSKTILIEFKQVWGNPAGPQIFGVGQKVWVSQWAADQLCGPNGYAEVVGRR